MKTTLLILFLFTSVCFAQIKATDWDMDIGFWNFSDDTTVKKIVVGNITYKNKIGAYQTMVMATILQQWKSYQKECYADSTLNEYATAMTTTTDTLRTNKFYRENPDEKRWFIFTTKKNIYNHKQPEFTDFMNWLERRIK